MFWNIDVAVGGAVNITWRRDVTRSTQDGGTTTTQQRWAGLTSHLWELNQVFSVDIAL